MSKPYKISKGWYKINQEEKEYPWPCVSEPGRKITIYGDDVLTKYPSGGYMKHTGLGCFGIKIPDEDLIYQENDANLVML